MPRYHALDTAVKLCVWDPEAASSSSTEKDNGVRTTASLAAGSLKNNGLAYAEKATSGPAHGYFVDDLTEHYFEGHEGVDFVAPGMPFYLVSAGKELFAGDLEMHQGKSSELRGNEMKPLPLKHLLTPTRYDLPRCRIKHQPVKSSHQCTKRSCFQANKFAETTHNLGRAVHKVVHAINFHESEAGAMHYNILQR